MDWTLVVGPHNFLLNAQHDFFDNAGASTMGAAEVVCWPDAEHARLTFSRTEPGEMRDRAVRALIRRLAPDEPEQLADQASTVQAGHIRFEAVLSLQYLTHAFTLAPARPATTRPAHRLA